MTSMLGHQGSDEGGLDLLAISRDADLLDLLARRAPCPRTTRSLALLAALAADVDEGLDELLVASEDDPLVRRRLGRDRRPGPAGPPVVVTGCASPRWRSWSAPRCPSVAWPQPSPATRSPRYKGIVTAMGGHGAEQHPGKARAFGADKQARSQLRHGDLAGAQASLAAMKAELLRDDLSSGDRQAIEAHIAALQKQVDHAVATAAAPQGGADGNGNGKTDDGTGANGKATGDTKGGDAQSTRADQQAAGHPHGRAGRRRAGRGWRRGTVRRDN